MFAAKTLQELGYTDVVSMAGGFGRWKNEGRPWITPAVLDARPARPLPAATSCCPRSAKRASRSCSSRKVLLLGAGGLGSPAALYLAAAGVGTLGIVDMDVVDDVEPAAPDPAQHGAHRRAQGRLRQEDAHRAEPRRRRRHLRRALRRRQHPRHHRRLRRRGRRHRQLPHALPAERRVAAEAHPRRARLDLPVRGSGHGVRARTTGRATAASCPSRRRRSSRRRARRPACSACCPASSGRSRRSRRSSCCSTSATRSSAACSRTTRSSRASATFKVRRDPQCPACGEDAEIVIAEYDQLCMPHAVLADGTTVGH